MGRRKTMDDNQLPIAQTSYSATPTTSSSSSRTTTTSTFSRRSATSKCVHMSPLLFTLLLFSSAAIFNGATAEDPSVDACRRQPFRGRCPATNGDTQARSQFVLRYYLRNGECVSYPYGHCANDPEEPHLYRYKEECEEACIGSAISTNKIPVVEGVKTHGDVKSKDKAAAIAASTPSSSPATTTTTQSTSATGTTHEATYATPTYETKRTDCQKQRERALSATAGSSLVKGGFVPECTASGDFKPLQCEPEAQSCFCVNAEGLEMKNSRAVKLQPNDPRPDCEKINSAPAPRTNECSGSAEAGPCVSTLARWFFDEVEQRCRAFNYSGCGGNGNNYASEQLCQRRCAPSDGGAEQRLCGASGHAPLKNAQGEIVDCGKTDCQVGYRCTLLSNPPQAICCPDTEVAPAAIEASKAGNLTIPKKQLDESTCQLPKDRGPCDKFELRFYFNKEAAECKYFFWGGCEGNANNFQTKEECSALCGASNATSTESTSAPTTTVATNIDTEVTTTETSEIPPTRPVPTLPPVTSRRPPPTSAASTRPPPTTAPLPSNRCLHPRDSGTCAAQFIRWYWNHEVRRCETFTYSGCNGNGNNFGSHEECLSVCHSEGTTQTKEPVTPPDLENICESDVDVGECSGSFMRYAYERISGECRQFQYGGCGGNGNNFASLADCKRRCISGRKTEAPNLNQENICEHPVEEGECSGIFHRFAYDKTSNECRQFNYGGCGGNGNNFATLAECRQACARVDCPPEPECDFSRCQIVKDGHGCPFCSCPPLLHRPPQPPQFIAPSPAQCPAIDKERCREPCLIFTNRLGCSECVCPSTPDLPVLPLGPATHRPPRPKTPQPRPHPPGHAQPPSEPLPPSAPPPPIISQGGPKINPVDTDNILLPPPPSPPPVFRELGEKCSQAADPGPCKRFVQRWHFNSASGDCEPFQYGGCAGNRNHFFTQNECIVHCARFSRNRQAQKALPPLALPTRPPPPPAPIVEGSVETFATRPSSAQPKRTLPPVISGDVSGPPPSPLPTQPSPPPPPPPPRPRTPPPTIVGDVTAPPPPPTESRQSPPTPSRATATKVVGDATSSRTAPPPEITGEVAGAPPPSPRILIVPIPAASTAAPAVPSTAQQSISTTTTSRTSTTAPTSITPRQLATAALIPSFIDTGVRMESRIIPPSSRSSSAPSVLPPAVFAQTRQPHRQLAIHPLPPQVPISRVESRPMRVEVLHQGPPPSSPPSNPVMMVETAAATTLQSTRGSTTPATTTSTTRKSTTTTTTSPAISSSSIAPTTIHASSTSTIVTQAPKRISHKPPEPSSHPPPPSSSHVPVGTIIIAEAAASSITAAPSSQTPPQPTSRSRLRIQPIETSDSVPTTTIASPTSITTAATAPTTTIASTTTSTSPTPPPLTEKITKPSTDPPFKKRDPEPPPKAQQHRPNNGESLGKEKDRRAGEEALVPVDGEVKKLIPPPLDSADRMHMVIDTMEMLYPPGATVAPLPSAAPTLPPYIRIQAAKKEEVTAALPIVPAASASGSSPPSANSQGEPTAAGGGKASSDGTVARRMLPVDIVDFASSHEAHAKVAESKREDGSSKNGAPPNRFSSSFEEVVGETGTQPTTTTTTASITLARSTSTSTSPTSTSASESTASITTTSSTWQPISTPSSSFSMHDQCTQPPDAGPCTDYVPRWFFNAQTARCEIFSYGSCGGNRNNFVERGQCEARCLRASEAELFANAQLPVRCTREKDEGRGAGYNPRWYFNHRNLRCEQMVYRGEGGNDNQFSSLTDCQTSCKPAHFVPEPIATSAATAPVIDQATATTRSSKIVDQDSQLVRGAAIAPGAGPPAPARPIEEVAVPAPPSRKYPAEPFKREEPNRLPILGASMPAVHNYQDRGGLVGSGGGSGGHAQAGVQLHVPPQQSGDKSVPSLGSIPGFVNTNAGVETKKTLDGIKAPSSQGEGPQQAEGEHIPQCPNGLSAMQYSDGRPLQCLPGRNQCPGKSVCYFNGLDFFCCPNEDDPYDVHIFGGYDGEEVKHGYKNLPNSLNIKSIRRRLAKREAQQQTGIGKPVAFEAAFSLDQKPPSGFNDAHPPQKSTSSPSQSSPAGKTTGAQLHPADPRRVNPCVQSADRGNCGEQHLRYFYDVHFDNCRLFYYTGCGGNANNFGTKGECEARCKLGIVLSSSAPISSGPAQTSSTPMPPGKCPDGQLPLGERSPVLCGNATDSIDCPPGYYCRLGPPDVCCRGSATGGKAESVVPGAKEIRRKPFISSAGSIADNHHQEHEHHDTEPPHHHIGTNSASQEIPVFVSQVEDISLTSTTQPHPTLIFASSASTESPSALVQTPPNMCPDGADGLVDNTGRPITCGTGFDGHELCPRGYYCSIDPERNGRLCCPMGLQQAVRVPNAFAQGVATHQLNASANADIDGPIVPSPSAEPPHLPPPYLGHRPANPGEVIDRGSLPSDPKPIRMATPKPKHLEEQQPLGGIHAEIGVNPLVANGSDAFTARAHGVIGVREPHPDDDEVRAAVEEGGKKRVEVDSATEQDDSTFGHMLLHKSITSEDSSPGRKAIGMDTKYLSGPSFEANLLTDYVEVSAAEDPFEARLRELKTKPIRDKSVCFLRPNEGRPCKEDEPSPLSNLQFFYSARDRACKIYFYHGCGGNSNRFESKRECEKYCMEK